jgi:two-component system, LuxR family, sensor histidine kinase DctS
MTDAAVPARSRRSRRRTALWALLVLLLVVAQTLLVALTVSYESSRSQDDIEAVAAEAARQMRREVLHATQQLQTLTWTDPGENFVQAAVDLMRTRPELLRVERRDHQGRVQAAADTPTGRPLFSLMPRADISMDTEAACEAARRQATPLLSRTYFVPLADGRGLEVADLCMPLQRSGVDDGYLVGSFGLPLLLDNLMTRQQSRRTEISLIEADGARLARAGGSRGAGVFVAERVVDLPGTSLRLRVDSAAGRPSLIPNFTLALVLGLSMALFAVVLLLARDVRRRAEAERALAEALAVRKAMEDSLTTGLRARNLDGEVTYANPAFCRMVGYSADELQAPEPPYWPPEFVEQYRQRHAARRSSRHADEQREGYETVFMRKSGERFPVVIYEAALLDSEGRQTGWMSTVLDVSAQRNMEDLSRQQQDRLQASARLATVGEMASLMSHELNQPLAAIASYASGSLNMLAEPDGDAVGMVRQGLVRIAEQAERAGRIIKSVHSFVRRREQQRETLGVDLLIDGVLPLVRLQARKSGTRIELDLPPRAPRVVCDRTMLEQVLINLTRNGIQAMETDTPLDERVLTLRVRQPHAQWVALSVIDRGHGIPSEVAAQLFTPFFTTRAEGMGLGLSLCRTVIEQHGGALDFGPAAPDESGAVPAGAAAAAAGARVDEAGVGAGAGVGAEASIAIASPATATATATTRRRTSGTEFRFTLPAARQAESRSPAARSP